MSPTERTSDFFVAGGTLPYHAPTYVKRRADDQLFELALAGEFVYVLTARQMGKSSLMVRTTQRLRQVGVRTVIIDLTMFGREPDNIWYFGLLRVIKRQLHLGINLETWWHKHSSLPTVQRFIYFLRDVVLSEIQEPVVLFIDEIDRTLSLEFRDDFFATIRAMYNARASAPEFKRLTFVLLGVASPSDLVKNPVRTPFNIGFPIRLEDFSKKEASVLQDGLEVVFLGEAQTIFEHIYHWTNGHPYLTQRLCLEIVQEPKRYWTNKQVIDAWVKVLFLKNGPRADDNLKWVESFILRHSQRNELLQLYQKVRQGKHVTDDPQSIIHNELKLSGLVKVENGYLRVRNEIYRHTFDLAWVQSNLPQNAIDRDQIDSFLHHLRHITGKVATPHKLFAVLIVFLVVLYGSNVAVWPFPGLGNLPSPTPTPIRAGIVLNEILSRPATDWNGDQTINSGDEYIEIVNASGTDFDITGMLLAHVVDDSSPYTLSGTLEPNMIVVFYGSETGIVLSDKEGDGVRLLGADGMVLDEYLYLEVPQDDQAWSRDEAKVWHTNWSPSPGEPNQPTESPTHVQTPTNAHAPPVLLAPEDNATITNKIPLQWSWDGTLQADEYFDVRVWREGEPATGIAWTKEKYYFFDPKLKGDGDYLWSVMVIRRRNGKLEANLSEPTPPRRLKIKLENGASITPTP